VAIVHGLSPFEPRQARATLLDASAQTFRWNGDAKRVEHEANLHAAPRGIHRRLREGLAHRSRQDVALELDTLTRVADRIEHGRTELIAVLEYGVDVPARHRRIELRREIRGKPWIANPERTLDSKRRLVLRQQQGAGDRRRSRDDDADQLAVPPHLVPWAS